MISKQPSRKTRTKLRKPKYLSLRFQLTAAKPPPPPPPPPQPPMPTTTTTTSDHSEQKQLINLFPLHPENLVEQLFSSCDDVDKAATTLTGILCSDDDDDDDEDDDVNTNNKPSPSSVNYVDHEVELVRTAMRRNKTERNNENDYNNGDDDDDEKWVCYSDIRGMSSSSSSTTRTMTSCCDRRKKLVLKLDYDKIMKSWVNKGPLFVRGDSGLGSGSGMDGSLLPQTVPELCDDDFFLPPLCVNGSRHDEQDNGGGSWTVPEMRRTENNSVSKGDDALQAMESSAMMHNREASVQRYKEKRRNRLFAKTIRYEVRKLNAEKRPRIKGRFVKRN